MKNSSFARVESAFHFLIWTIQFQSSKVQMHGLCPTVGGRGGDAEVSSWSAHDLKYKFQYVSHIINYISCANLLLLLLFSLGTWWLVTYECSDTVVGLDILMSLSSYLRCSLWLCCSCFVLFCFSSALFANLYLRHSLVLEMECEVQWL